MIYYEYDLMKKQLLFVKNQLRASQMKSLTHGRMNGQKNNACSLQESHSNNFCQCVNSCDLAIFVRLIHKLKKIER